MKNLKNTAFYLGIALLLTHEMDTMPNHEWRVLPVVRSLSESAGEVTFLLAHVSIFALLIAFIASLNHRVRRLARNLTCAFSIVHAGLH